MSSYGGDIVLDPLARCAATCVFAERLQRQWVGIDICNKVEKILLERMDKEGILISGEQLRE